jgi:hypothetical protein
LGLLKNWPGSTRQSPLKMKDKNHDGSRTGS